MTIKTDIDQLVADAAHVHAWANGNATHTETFGAQSISSPAKLIADKTAQIDAAAAQLAGLTASTAELNYTDGVTSNIQTQLDAKQAYDADIPTVAASQAEMEAGTEAALRSMSPLRVAQAISALSSGLAAASTAEAIAGTSNTVAITPLKMREGFNASGSAPVYACRAWVNFNGTGTVYIRASGNVSSVTNNGTGDYTVNFTTAMVDADFSLVASCGNNDNNGMMVSPQSGTFTTSAARFVTRYHDNGAADSLMTLVAVFR